MEANVVKIICFALVSMGALACLPGGARLAPTASKSAEAAPWPEFASPAEVTIPGGVFQAARVAADDFAPPGAVEKVASPRDRCLASQAAYTYRVVRDETRHLYFVRMSPGDHCDANTVDLGAEYAIDDRNWSIQGKRTAWEVPPLQLPYLAYLAFADCPTCNARPQAAWPFVYGLVGMPRDHTFYVQNLGEQSATGVGDGGGLASGFAFKGGAYPGLGGTCGASIAGGERCSIVVTFAPGGEEESISAITLAYHDGATRRAVTRPVRGGYASRAYLVIGDAPGDTGGASYAPPDHDYGTAGIPQDHTFFVQNTGAQPAVALRGGGLEEGFSFKGGSYPGSGGTCGSSLASGEHCTVVVTFTPIGDGPRSSTLTIAYDNGFEKEPATRTLRGTATKRALLAIAAYGTASGCGERCGPFDFGTVAGGAESIQGFTLFNKGAAAITTLSDGGGLSGPFDYPGGGYPGLVSTCGNIPPGGSCPVLVRFRPTAPGGYVGSLAIDYGDDLGPPLQVRRTIRGTAE